MKRTKLSPVISLVVSLSLVVGILVSDLAGARLLTAAHAQTSGGCAGQSSVRITRGLLSGGVVVHNVTVGGQLVALAYIPGSVQIARGSVGGVNGVIVSDGSPGAVEGVIVSDGGPNRDGVIVSDGSPNADRDGVIVSDGITANGVIVSDGGSVIATGGTISGEGVSVENGVITGYNLVLRGATISGSMGFNGTVTKIRVNPAH